MNGISVKEALDELRMRYSRDQVSVLIGAGFSKNAYSKYPNWDELLEDMVLELFGSDIERDFNSQQHVSPVKTNKSDFYKNAIKQVIQREGYLDLVQKYLDNKGIREVIEQYIEERMPKIDENGILEHGSFQQQLTDQELDVHKKLLEGSWDNIYTTNYDTLLEYTADRYGKRWNKIKRAQELSFSQREKSIIKLHGSLAKSGSTEFEFDNDFHKRYIIAKEDYETYPEKHSAFTQLMRLSLLRGTFLLLGFSGNDPNFISWVKWVRDILVMKRDDNGFKNPCKDIRIYLIDIADKLPSPANQQFYENHKIYYIPLLSKDVQEVLNVNGAASVREAILNLLNFVYHTNNNDKYDYNSIWGDTYGIKRVAGKEDDEVTISHDAIQRLQTLKEFNRFVNPIYRQQNYIEGIYHKTVFTKDETALAFMAFEDTMFLGENYPQLFASLKNAKLTETQKSQIRSIELREQTLNHPKGELRTTDDTAFYEKVLRLAFTLRFDDLYNLLLQWEPKGLFVIKKALFLSVFKRQDATDLLCEYIDNETNPYNCSLATSLLNFINQFSSRYSTVKYHNQNIPSLREITNEFLGSTKKEDEAVTPFGQKGVAKRVIGETEHINPSSFRFLQFMIEAPCFFSYGLTTTISRNNAYKVIHELYENYPWPAMFYALQIREKEVVKRIGQEFAYSETLHPMLPQLLNALLDCGTNKHVSWYLHENMMYLASEIVVAVQPRLWEYRFGKLWDEMILELKSDSKLSIHEGLKTLLSNASRYISAPKIQRQVLADCLAELPELKQTDLSIGILYYMKVKKIVLNDDLSVKIEAYIQNIEHYNQFTVLGNIHNLLNKEHIKLAARKFDELYVQSQDVNSIAFNALCFITKGNRTLERKVRLAVIHHKRLWDNGIHDNYATDINPLPLSSFSTALNWTDTEIKNLFARMKRSLSVLLKSKYYDRQDYIFMIGIDRLLEEMRIFMISHRHRICRLPGYAETRKTVMNELYKQGGFASLRDALISEDKNAVIMGLKELNRKAETDLAESADLIQLLSDRILFRNPVALTECLDFLQFMVKRYYKQPENVPQPLTRNIIHILTTYNPLVLLQVETRVPQAMKHLVSLALFYKDAMPENDEIKRWLKYKEDKLFNELNFA